MPTVEARVTGVQLDEGTGWYRISLDDERVKRLDTKVREKAVEAAALQKSGALALIEFTERPGNTNPHTGRPYMNRYYEHAGSLAETNGGSDDGIERVAQTGRKTDPGDAWRMCLNKGGELAVRTLPLMEQRGFDVQKQIAYAWADFFYNTPPPARDGVANFGGFSVAPVGESFADFGGDSAPPHGDDDIPF